MPKVVFFKCRSTDIGCCLRTLRAAPFFQERGYCNVVIFNRPQFEFSRLSAITTQLRCQIWGSAPFTLLVKIWQSQQINIVLKPGNILHQGVETIPELKPTTRLSKIPVVLRETRINRNAPRPLTNDILSNHRRRIGLLCCQAKGGFSNIANIPKLRKYLMLIQTSFSN